MGRRQIDGMERWNEGGGREGGREQVRTKAVNDTIPLFF